MYNRAKAAVREFANRIRQRPTQSPMEDIPNPAPELHLPKGILPTFSGDYGEWSSFYDLFVSSVHNNHQLTKAQKLFYLKTYTTGRAAAVLKHLKVEDNAYEGALEALRKRFDRKDQIVNHHVQRFMDIPSTTVGSVGALRRLYETADDVSRALKALQREERDCWLIYILLIILDDETRQLWYTKTTLSEEAPSLEDFLIFIEQRSYALETSQSSAGKANLRQCKAAPQRSSSFVATSNSQVGKCIICKEQPHPPFFCQQFKAVTPKDRLKLVEKHGLCKNCLRPKHGTGLCQAGSCKNCKQNHHTLLHDGLQSAAPQLSFAVTSNFSINDDFSSVLLATAVVNVLDAHGKPHRARVLLDSASQASFITTELAKQLGIQPNALNMPLRGISGITTQLKSSVTVTLQSRVANYAAQVHCAILPEITGTVPHRFVDISNWDLQSFQPLADDCFNTPGKIDLLLGASLFYQLLDSERISLGRTKPVLQKTCLGWVVAGFCDDTAGSDITTSCLIGVAGATEESATLNQLRESYQSLIQGQ
ncbi:uncharacterized protein LOC131680232 [Topomyia yanbarensis]|uniref:uncharacterized protein LOC131680232 n=1 Tax=Topomyia yanbarensis TaxID=2498891 RepID=UPI00273B1860|nr:uncharacterized protein LOC131680232 [Topomyia yanbarensis]